MQQRQATGTANFSILRSRFATQNSRTTSESKELNIVMKTAPSDTTKRADIITAAITEFRVLGSGGARADEIVKQVKVSKRTLCRYFLSKQLLFEAIIMLALNRHPPEIDGSYDKTRSVSDQLRDLVDAYLKTISTEQFIALARVVTAEYIRQPKLARAVEKNAPKEKFVHFFTKTMASGAMRIGDPHRAAMQLTALLKAFFSGQHSWTRRPHTEIASVNNYAMIALPCSWVTT